ncbi:MAG: glycerophosphodiester phosphodiesterase [Actinomycetota bacterium]
MQQRLPSLLEAPIAFAHRGASAHAQENTLDAFALALRLGSSGLETDLWLTEDNEPVLDHDGVVRNLFRKRPIRDVRRSDLPPHIPTLAGLVERVGSNYHLSIDVKDPHAFGVIVDQAGLSGFPLEQLWLCHPDAEVLHNNLDTRVSVKRVHSTRLAKMPAGPERHAADLQRLGIHVVNMHHSDWTGGLTTLFHRFGILCFAWDVQHETKMSDVVRMGIDGVYSDHVDMMMEVIQRETDHDTMWS